MRSRAERVDALVARVEALEEAYEERGTILRLLRQEILVYLNRDRDLAEEDLPDESPLRRALAAARLELYEEPGAD